MKAISVFSVAALSLGLASCAAIPPGSDYVSCSGSSAKYMVCKRIKNCGPGHALFFEDHYFDGKLHKTVEPDCAAD